MHTQQTALARLRQFAAEVRRLIPVRHVILFGSYARNEQRSDSDIDVALVADQFVGLRFINTVAFSQLLAQRPYLDLEPHTFNTAAYEDPTSPLAEIVKATGIVVA